MAVEFEEESGVMYHIMGQAKEKGPLAKKKVTAALASSPSIDDLAQSSGKLKTGKKKDTKITSALIEEFLLQHKLLEDEVRLLRSLQLHCARVTRSKTLPRPSTRSC
jgi:hypothetical protein